MREPASPPGGGTSKLELSGESTLISPATRPLNSDHGRYVLKHFHARGGMGEIWVSEDVRLGREVALKTLWSTGIHARERFVTEAQVTGQLEHPGVVPVHDMGVDDTGKPYYIMKFVRGRSLKHAIAEYHAATTGAASKEVQLLKLLQVFLGLCHVVAYAHSRGVLHRDLKPDNVMLGEYGETLLLDWGLAKLRGQPEHSMQGSSAAVHTSGTHAGTQTEQGSILGSPLYMPPEMAEGRAEETDERTDVYLLGAMLYEILTGRTLREGRSREEILELARTSAPIPPRKLNPSIERPLEAICLKALGHRKEDRYPGPMELASDMQRHLAREPVSSYQETIAERAWRWCRRHRRLLRNAAVIAVIGGVTLLTTAKFRELAQRQAEAKRVAAELQARETARAGVAKFEQLLNETRYFAANTDSPTERVPYYDPQTAQTTAQRALDIAAPWGDTFEHLPLADQQPLLRKQTYDLLLLLAHLEISRPSPATARLDDLLNRAQRLNPGLSRGFHRMKGQVEARAGRADSAQAHFRQADAAGTPVRAIDYFLLGEQQRKQAADEVDLAAGVALSSTQRRQHLLTAIDAYQKALATDPQDYWSHFQLGRCYMSLGRLSEAIEALGACVALRPDAPWGYSARSLALGLAGRFAEGERDLARALQLEPDFRPAILNRGILHWLQHQRREALADFTAAMEPPDNRRIFEAGYYRAQVNIEAGSYDGAKADLDNVLEARPAFSPARLLRAKLSLLTGNAASAMSDLTVLCTSEQATTETPAFRAKRGKFLRGIAAQLPPHAMAQALGLARDDLTAAARFQPPPRGANADLGAVLELLGQQDSALAAYNVALAEDPSNAAARRNRGWFQQKLQLYDAAAKDFRDVLRADPADAEAHAGLGYVKACTRASDEAHAEADRALLYGAGDYLILHDVACIHAELARGETQRRTFEEDEAIAFLRRALELWRTGNAGPDEIQLIEHEPAFGPALRARPDFQQLLVRN